MKEKCEKLTGLLKEIHTEHPDASAVLLASSGDRKCRLYAGFGDDKNLAIELALLMHREPAFAAVIGLTVNIYKNGPRPSDILLPKPPAEKPAPAPAEGEQGEEAKETAAAAGTEEAVESPAEPDRYAITLAIQTLINELNTTVPPGKSHEEISKLIEGVLLSAIRDIDRAIK